jgi:uncharacterized membrane protein
MDIAILYFILTTNSISYTKDVKPLIQTHCSQCHNANWPDKNWLDYDIAFKNKDKIKLRVENQTMPPGNFTGISKEERNIIVNWVKQGGKK